MPRKATKVKDTIENTSEETVMNTDNVAVAVSDTWTKQDVIVKLEELQNELRLVAAQSNKIQKEIRKLQLEKETRVSLGSNTDDVEERIEIYTDNLVELKERGIELTEKVSYYKDKLHNELRAEELAKQRNVAKEMVDNIKLPIEPHENPRLYARLISSMANTLQNALVYDEDIFTNMKAQLNAMDEPVDEISAQEYKKLSDRVELKTAEREFSEVMLHALFELYNKAKNEHPLEAGWFPNFLYKSNDTIRKDVEEKAAKRAAEYAEQKRRIKEESTNVIKQEVLLSMPSFN